jgi:hypothetical protein
MAAFLLATLSALTPAASPAAAEPPDGVDVARLADRIDHFIEKRCRDESVPLAALSSEPEFLRRAFLDLTGRIPAAAEVYAFLADKRPAKRRQIVETLLDSPRFIEHQTNLWRGLLLPDDNNAQVLAHRLQLEGWLRQRLRDGVPLDRLVRELLTTPVGSGPSPPDGAGPDGVSTSPAAFYRANQARPENLAAATARIFLGVRLECAQCHNLPFDRWTRAQFWEFAAFFAGLDVRRDGGNRILSIRERPGRPALRIPETAREVSPRFLDGGEPDWGRTADARAALAAWVTAPANPFFARAAANRLWSQLFGLGLVEPADDFSDSNPPSHPELLDELARQLVAHRYDMKYLPRAILASRAYQRSSTHPRGSPAGLRLFARMPVRGLRPEQLFDSIVLATGYPEPGQRPAFRADFLARFAAASENRTEQQTSVLQVLALMNGAFLGDATTLSRGRLLTGISEAPWLDTPGRIQALFVATLSRLPTAEESRRLTAYVSAAKGKETKGQEDGEKRALADVLWSLLNSSEFLFNH